MQTAPLMMDPIGYWLALGLAIVHGFATQIPIERWVPRFRWMSFAGGVSLSFVFLEVFPELSHAQAEIEHAESVWLGYLENHVYVLALIGLIFFYLVDVLVLQVRRRESANALRNFPVIFWVHMAVFAMINLITGYLIQELSHHSLVSCFYFFAAIALHFFVMDEHLRSHHAIPYDRVGRWVLVSCIILGAVIGQNTVLSPLFVTVIWSFLAGSIILNVLKRELPDEKDSCVLSFVTGTLLFSSLLFLK